MTNTTFYEFLYDWIDLVINTIGGRTIPIIQSHQNAPEPSGQFIVIEYSPNKQKIGRACVTEPLPAGDPNEGQTQIISNYNQRAEFWEVGGDGNLLAEIVESIEREQIKTFFNTKDVSFFRAEPIQSIPRLENEKWVQQSVVEILFGVASEIKETPGWIETVETTGTIGGHTI